MKDVLLYMVQGIALDPDKISIEEKTVDSQVDFYITCGQEDIGRIIGKKGKIIKALRRVLGIMAVKEGKRVSITMVDPTSPDSSRFSEAGVRLDGQTEPEGSQDEPSPEETVG